MGWGYIATHGAADRFRLTELYVQQLARMGLVRGIRVGGEWFVDPVAMIEYLAGTLPEPDSQDEGIARLDRGTRA